MFAAGLDKSWGRTGCFDSAATIPSEGRLHHFPKTLLQIPITTEDLVLVTMSGGEVGVQRRTP
jgi:hypothetical protein